MWSWSTNVTDGQTRRTGGGTDRRHAIARPRFAHSASRGKNDAYLLENFKKNRWGEGRNPRPTPMRRGHPLNFHTLLPWSPKVTLPLLFLVNSHSARGCDMITVIKLAAVFRITVHMQYSSLVTKSCASPVTRHACNYRITHKHVLQHSPEPEWRSALAEWINNIRVLIGRRHVPVDVRRCVTGRQDRWILSIPLINVTQSERRRRRREWLTSCVASHPSSVSIAIQHMWAALPSRCVLPTTIF